MRCYVQWTNSEAADWQEIDDAGWEALATKPEPVGGESLDSDPGWVNAVCVQGVEFQGYDHYAVWHEGGSCWVAVWNDDPNDWIPWTLHGQVWRFGEVKQDRRIGMRWNTDQERVFYAERDFPSRQILVNAGQAVRPWSEFSVPPRALVKHGIQVESMLLFGQHDEARRELSWHEEIPGGEPPVPFQPLHQSRTYLFNAPDTSDSDCTPAAANNRKMDEAGQTSQGLASPNMMPEVDSLSHAFTTEAGDPNVVDWPAASGGDSYDASFDVSAAGADVTFGLLTISGSAGRFHRVNSSCTTQENWSQGESAFSGTGVKVATNTSIDPSSGAAGDRFQCLFAARNNATMGGNQSFTILTNSSSFGMGPWVALAIPDQPLPSGPAIVPRAKRQAVAYGGGF